MAELKLVFRIVPTHTGLPLPDDCFLTYCTRFDVIPQINEAISGSKTRPGRYPEPVSSLFCLRRATRSDGRPLGDIMPLRQIRQLVDLIPRFKEQAHNQLTYSTSSHYYSEFWLNKYFEKELFLALS